jgi:hypothetical protein
MCGSGSGIRKSSDPVPGLEKVRIRILDVKMIGSGTGIRIRSTSPVCCGAGAVTGKF